MQIKEQYHSIWGVPPTEFVPAMKWIEKAGRTCYDSRDKITEDSWKPMLNHLLRRGHLSVFEHVDVITDNAINSRWEAYAGDGRYANNLRVFIERYGIESVDDLEPFFDGNKQNISNPMITVEFFTNRAMMAELTRHRLFCGFSIKSTRYCRESEGLVFIKPVKFEEWHHSIQDEFTMELHNIELTYLKMLNRGLPAQQARNILPQALSTVIVMTTRLSQWKTIFELRCSSAADPQMQALIKPLRDELLERFSDA